MHFQNQSQLRMHDAEAFSLQIDICIIPLYGVGFSIRRKQRIFFEQGIGDRQDNTNRSLSQSIRWEGHTDLVL